MCVCVCVCAFWFQRYGGLEVHFLNHNIDCRKHIDITHIAFMAVLYCNSVRPFFFIAGVFFKNLAIRYTRPDWPRPDCFEQLTSTWSTIEISISTLILHNWFHVAFSVLTAETHCLTKYSNPLILHWYYLLCWREALWEIMTFIGSHHKRRPMWGLSGGFSGTTPCCSDLCFLYHFMHANMCWAVLGMLYLRGLAALCS